MKRYIGFNDTTTNDGNEYEYSGDYENSIEDVLVREIRSRGGLLSLMQPIEGDAGHIRLVITLGPDQDEDAHDEVVLSAMKDALAGGPATEDELRLALLSATGEVPDWLEMSLETLTNTGALRCDDESVWTVVDGKFCTEGGYHDA